MKQDDTNTQYDKTINRLKNTHWIVILLIFSIFVAGLTTFLTNFSTIRDFFTPTENPAPKIRVQYYTVGGHAISLLLVGALDPSLQKHLEGKPIIWQNTVFQELRTLHNTYAQQIMEYSDFSGLDFTKEELEAFKKSTKLIPFSTYGAQQIIDLGKAFSSPEIGDPLKSPDWKISFKKEVPTTEITNDFKNGKIRLTSLIFTKRLSCKNAIIAFDNFNYPVINFLKRNGINNCVDLDFNVTAQYFDDVCDDSHHWIMSLDLPGLSMAIAVVQNISNDAIKIDSITFGKNIVDGIGPLSISKKLPDLKGTVGDGTLLPSDRLIIPLSLRFSDEFTDANHYYYDKTYKTSEIGEKEIDYLIKKYPTVDLMSFTPPPGYINTFSLSTASPTSAAHVIKPTKNKHNAGKDVQPIVLASIPSEWLRSKYGYTPTERILEAGLPYIGTILSPKNAVVNGLSQEIHGIETGGMYVSDFTSGASCPYLFAETTDGTTLPLGKILVGHDTFEKDAVDFRHIPTWPTKIIIKELDPETTYLSSVALICETENGEIFTQQSINNQLQGKVLAAPIKQGEKSTIHFSSLPAGITCKNIFAKVGGYYIPDASSITTRTFSLKWYTLPTTNVNNSPPSKTPFKN